MIGLRRASGEVLHGERNEGKNVLRFIYFFSPKTTQTGLESCKFKNSFLDRIKFYCK